MRGRKMEEGNKEGVEKEGGISGGGKRIGGY